MKIGFVTERMLRGFGVDLVVDRVARGLAGKGHEVTVYASVSDETLGDDGYRVEMIPTPAFSFFPRYDLSAQQHLDKLNREDNDILLIETFPFFSYLPRLKMPAIAVDHGVSSTEGFPARLKANFLYMQLMQQRVYFRYAERIVTVSEYLKSILPGSLRDRTTVIYNGADHYPPGEGAGAQELRQQLGVGPGETLLLYVGRLNPDHQPYKGTAELVRLYRTLRQDRPDLRLLMVGFGGPEDRQWLEGEGALVIDNAPAEQMPDIFSACDIYVTASRWEGFDLPLVEAQSFGKPVVAYDIGAHPEVVDRERSGFLVSELVGLGAAVDLLHDSPELRKRMGSAARHNAAHFVWSRAVEEYESLIEELIA